VVAGETNSGKTTLVNLLLRAELLTTDIVPNTPCPILLRFGETAHLRLQREDGEFSIHPLSDLHRLGRTGAQFAEVILPSSVLRRIEILDLPGLVSAEDAQSRSRWMKATDIIIWCTPATQAWKASELAMWQALGLPQALSLLVLTHRDLLSARQFEDVAQRISRETQHFFSHWSAIATSKAIAARNPRGQIVKKDVWIATGVEDFMKKLVYLLQNVPTPSSERRPDADKRPMPADEAAPADNRGVPHPLPAFAALKKQIRSQTAQSSPKQQTSGLLANELAAYCDQILTPWLDANRWKPAEAATLVSLVRISEAELAQYFPTKSGGYASRASFMVLDQIEAELGDVLRN
jgi:hypothetical protein